MNNKKKIEWPEHISWWDRNEFKINITLWGVFLALLIIAFFIFKSDPINFDLAVIWMLLFITDLFLLSFASNGVHK